MKRGRLEISGPAGGMADGAGLCRPGQRFPLDRRQEADEGWVRCSSRGFAPLSLALCSTAPGSQQGLWAKGGAAGKAGPQAGGRVEFRALPVEEMARPMLKVLEAVLRDWRWGCGLGAPAEGGGRGGGAAAVQQGPPQTREHETGSQAPRQGYLLQQHPAAWVVRVSQPG